MLETKQDEVTDTHQDWEDAVREIHPRSEHASAVELRVERARDSGVANGLDTVEQDRLIGNRNQLLGACMGNGPQSRALSSAKDYGLDLDQLLSGHAGRVIPRTLGSSRVNS